MAYELSESCKEKAVANMTKNLQVLRTMLHLSQAELAAMIGLGRQTFVAIENEKRKMTWNTFLSLLFVFSQNAETAALLEIFGIYTKEMKRVYTNVVSRG